MTAATFYTGVKNQNRFLRRWLEADVLARGENALVYTGDDERASELDLFLWTANESDFLPHALCESQWAAKTPIVLAAAPPPDDMERNVLINLAPDLPPFLDRFERLVELVGDDEASKRRGRAHYRRLRDDGHAVASTPAQF